MRTFLALLATLAVTAAYAHKPGPVPANPCADKGQEVIEKCSAECFKIDPNAKDQAATKAELKCMTGCNKKSGDAIKKCEEAAAKKKEPKQEKDQTEHTVEYN